MSTVTLSQPHCAMTSAENPEGIASHPLTAAFPAFHRSFSLFSAMSHPFLIFGFPGHRITGTGKAAMLPGASSLLGSPVVRSWLRIAHATWPYAALDGAEPP